MSSDDLVSTKELASKLKVTEPLLKKLLKDFDIETQRVDRRAHLDTKASTTVKEILALRASGKKNSEIKEMFDASKKAASPKAETPNELKADSSAQEAKEEKPKKKLVKKVLKKKPAAKKPKKETEEADSDTPEEDTDKAIKNKSKKEEVQDAEIIAKEEPEVDEKTDGNSIMDISGYLQDEDEEEENELKALLSIEEGDEEISSLDDDTEEVEEVREFSDETLSPRKIRRRQFSFKYIQRQIANDSKRVNYIKQKLNRGHISEKERMMLEDSLSKRAVLLSGWIQLLRWVKN